MKRNRLTLLLFIILLMISGLLSRMNLGLPSIFNEFAGDILWASMMYYVFAFLFVDKRIRWLFVCTLLFSISIEVSQLLTWDWLVYLRSTLLRYILGQGFLWSDLLCYGIGVCAAAALDNTLLERKQTNEE